MTRTTKTIVVKMTAGAGFRVMVRDEGSGYGTCTAVASPGSGVVVQAPSA